MKLTKETKKEIFKKHGKSEKDTGAAESQIALFTHRITNLTEHLQVKKKDVNTMRSLILLVSKRKRILNHLKKTDIVRYRTVIKTLDIRK